MKEIAINKLRQIEQAQEDIITFGESQNLKQEMIDNLCQIVVDNFKTKTRNTAMKTITIKELHDLLGFAYAVCLNDTLYYVGYDDNDNPFVADNYGDDYVSLAEVDGDIQVLDYGFFFRVAEQPITLKLLSLMDADEMVGK